MFCNINTKNLLVLQLWIKVMCHVNYIMLQESTKTWATFLLHISLTEPKFSSNFHTKTTWNIQSCANIKPFISFHIICETLSKKKKKRKRNTHTHFHFSERLKSYSLLYFTLPSLITAVPVSLSTSKS